MNALLNAFMFGSSNCLWNLTRPIFSIYLVKREAFDSYISNVSVNQQPIVIVTLMNDTKELLKDMKDTMCDTATKAVQKFKDMGNEKSCECNCQTTTE